MSYQSEVLADNPVVYLRLDFLGSPSNGQEVTDLSGNDLHGSLSYSGSTMPWGYSPLPGGLETDAANREFRGYGQSISGTDGAAMISVGNDSLMAVTNDFTVEGFLRPQSDIPLAGTFAGIQKQGTGGIGLSSVGGGTRICGYCFDNAATLWVVTANFLATDYLGQAFHTVVVRSGNALLLYIDGTLRGTTTITSGLPTLSNSNPFTVHSSPGAYDMRYDEAAFYTDDLSSTRILAHYEASKAVLPLRATITINIGVELNTDQIVPVELGFPHNYSGTFSDSQIPIVEELTRKTNVNQSEPDYQQRVNAQPHGALRSIEYHLSPTSGAARSRLQGALYTPAEFYTLPVWRDAGVTTGAANSGTNTIPVDTVKRRYEVGSYCGTATDLQNPTTYQFFKISAVSNTQVTLATNIGTTIPSGSPVFPACLASISEDSLSMKSYAADHEDSIIRFDVLETELFTRDTTAYTPGTTYLSKEVLTLESAKYSFLDEKPFSIARRIQASGRDYQYGRDTGSPHTFPVRFLLTTRAQLSEFFGWLDARQGRANPLWVSTKEKDLIVTATPAHNILTVTKTGFSFHHGRRDVEILKTDGTFARERAMSVTDNGSTETWTFGPAVNLPGLVDISKVSFLKYCTLASDSAEIRYYKGGANGAVIAECNLSFRDLLTSPS